MAISWKVYVSGFGYGTAHWSGEPGSRRTLCGKYSKGLHGNPDRAWMCRTCVKAMAKLVAEAWGSAQHENARWDAEAAAAEWSAQDRAAHDDAMEILGEIAAENIAAAQLKLDELHAEALEMNNELDQAAAEEGYEREVLGTLPTYGTVEIHTAGELHTAPEMPAPDFTYNLSRLLDDPAHRPDAGLIKLDGTDHRVQEFVFLTEGALDLYEDMVRDIERQLKRGKHVVVLVLCRGGKHRSVAFGENLAALFDVAAKHHHKHLPRVLDAESRVPNTVQTWAAYAAKLKTSRDAAEQEVCRLIEKKNALKKELFGMRNRLDTLVTFYADRGAQIPAERVRHAARLNQA